MLEMLASSQFQFSHSVLSNSLRPHRLQQTRPPCPSPTPEAYSNSCPSSQWCHPIISSCVIPFSSSLQYFLSSGYFPMSQFFTSGGHSIGVSANSRLMIILPQCYTSIISQYGLKTQTNEQPKKKQTNKKMRYIHKMTMKKKVMLQCGLALRRLC